MSRAAAAPERTLPHDLDAERAVLGAVLLHEDLFHSVLDVLTTTDFYRDAHRRIYTAMLDLHEDRQAVDFLTVKHLLDRTGQLDEIGGPAYLSALTDGIPKSANIAHYAAIVVEQSRLRAAIAAGTKLVASAHDADREAAVLLGETAEKLFELGGAAVRTRPVLVRELLQAGMAALERAHANMGFLTGLSTGFTELDEMTAGLQPSDLVLIAGRTSKGKTAIAVNIARHVAVAHTVLFFSLEMSKTQLLFRLLSGDARVEAHRMRAGVLGDKDWGKLSHAMAQISEAKLLIDDTPGIGVMEVRAKARQVRAEHGLDLIVVDYLQLMRGRGKFDNRTQEIGTISRGLKALAKELDVPVVALAQLSRATEARKDKRPQLSDLRESGDLENDADVVLLLHRPEGADVDEGAEGLAEVIIAKQRNGPTGSVKLAFLSEFTRFENLAPQVA